MVLIHMEQELVQVLTIIVLLELQQVLMVAHVILLAEHIVSADIVRVQVVVLIQRKQDVLVLHYVRVQQAKVRPMVAIVLVVDIQGLMGSANALTVNNILAGVVVLQQHPTYVQQEKQQQQPIHVTVQVGEHLLEPVELELVNVQMVKHILQHLAAVVLRHSVHLHM